MHSADRQNAVYCVSYSYNQTREGDTIKSRWERPNEYTEFWNGTLCKVYNYNLNTIKEMEKEGWKVQGTYICYFTFWKDKD